MKLLWEDRAWEDYWYWQQQDKKIVKRINILIKDIQRNVYTGCIASVRSASVGVQRQVNPTRITGMPRG